jgi:hypothetical protein
MVRACRGGHLWNGGTEVRLCPKCYGYGKEVEKLELRILKALRWRPVQIPRYPEMSE